MGEQLIVSISREFGSGGHEIARKLADRLGLAFYDRCMLDEIAEQMNADVSDFHKYDERPGNRLLSRRVGNHTNSYEEIIAQFQFDYIRKKAESGESFVVVGRCSENVLKDYDCLISVFVTGDKEHKIQRELWSILTYPSQRHILKCADTTEQENSIITDTQKVNGEMQHIMICVSTAVLWE